jgi:hypothetical protein
MTPRETVNRVSLFDAPRLLDSDGSWIATPTIPRRRPGMRPGRAASPKRSTASPSRRQIGDSCEFRQEISPRKELLV